MLNLASATGVMGIDPAGHDFVKTVGTADDDFIRGDAVEDGVSDLIKGLGGDDMLEGMGGDDRLIGGDGQDWLNGGDGNDTLIGGDGDDVLRGSGSDFGLSHDRMFGNGGDDTIIAGYGVEVISGGPGFDEVQFNGVGDDSGVVVDLSHKGPQDVGQETVTLTGIEALMGSFASDHLIGSKAGDMLNGAGGPGNDTLEGGKGDDLLVVDGTGACVANGGKGIDTLLVSGGFAVHLDMNISGAQNDGFSTIDLRGIENLMVQNDFGLGDSLAGDGRDNVLGGNSGSDSLAGGGGDDRLLGDGGYSSWDSFGQPGVVYDLGPGADTLSGGDGDDTIVGARGADVLSGGEGTDSFDFLRIEDSNSANGIDTITDLQAQDFIYLNPIDADVTKDGDQAFVIVKAFNGHAGQMVVSYDKDGGLTHFSMDVDGDAVADMDIQAVGDQREFVGFVL